MRNWFTMKKVEDDQEDPEKKKNPFAEIMIYDAIGASFMGESTVSASAFVTALADLGDVPEIKLRINSPGGDVFDGVAIYNAIKNHKAKVTAHIDGLAASAASFVAMAADRIVMPSNAFMLVHNASGFAMGQADDMRSVADDLDRIDKSMTATYVARTKQPTPTVRKLMKEDRLMDAKEAKELGFADEISPPVKLAASYALPRDFPKAAAARFRAVTGTEQGDPPQSATGPQGAGEQPVVPPPPPPQPRHEPGTEQPKLPPDPFKTPGYQEHPAPVEPQEQPPQTRPGPPDPPPTPGTPRNVVDFNAAKQQGVEEHRKYVQAITDLCTLARAPERVGGYVRAGVTADQVRRELLDAAVHAPVLPQHPMATQPAVEAWSKITDKLNARHK